MMHVKPRALRGVAAVRADASDPKALLEALNKAFETFKTEHTAEIAALRKDIVQTEKVDRINNSITELQAALDETNKKIAAATLGGGGGNKLTAEQRAHATGFNNYFRRGVESGLRDLEVKAALATDSNPDGGYIVPVEMETTIDRVLGTVSAMRNLATVRQISTGVYKKPVGQGGASSGWVGERESRSETNTPTLAELSFPAMELYAEPRATQAMLDDAAINVESWLADEVAIEFAEEEGAAFISGSGVNRPRGILGYSPVANASYAWGNPGYLATGVAADINDGSNNGVDSAINMVYAIKAGYRAGASWIMNRTLQGKYRKLKDGDSNYLWTPPQQGGIQGMQPAALLGYPIADDDNMPDVGANTYPVAFGNFKRAYIIVDRVGIRVLRDPFTAKPYVKFYTTKRVGGGVQNFEAYKLLKCATS